jgi:hypothetical protein
MGVIHSIVEVLYFNDCTYYCTLRLFHILADRTVATCILICCDYGVWFVAECSALSIMILHTVFK